MFDIVMGALIMLIGVSFGYGFSNATKKEEK